MPIQIELNIEWAYEYYFFRSVLSIQQRAGMLE